MKQILDDFSIRVSKADANELNWMREKAFMDFNLKRVDINGYNIMQQELHDRHAQLAKRNGH